MGRKFKPGESGNPNGAKTVNTIKEALRIAANEEVALGGRNTKRVKKLRLAAEAMLDEAIKGNVAAFKEIADRLDGKVAQTHDIKNETTITHRSETLSRFDEWIAEASTRPADSNGADVGPERSVFSDKVPPESTRH